MEGTLVPYIAPVKIFAEKDALMYWYYSAVAPAEGDLDRRTVSRFKSTSSSTIGAVTEMFIQEVIISRVNGYGPDTSTNELHPALNVFVGSNGTGKTTLLYAINFVLMNYREFFAPDDPTDDEFDVVRPDLPYVEVVILDEQDQLSFGTNQIRIRRTYNEAYTTTRFSVNGVPVSRVWMSQFLEMAFPTPPFAFLHQTEITNFTIYSPLERLKRLNEVTGVTDFRDNVANSRTELESLRTFDEDLRVRLVSLSEKLSVLEAESQTLERSLKLRQRIKAARQKTLVDDLRRIDDSISNVRANMVTLEQTWSEKVTLLREINDTHKDVDRELDNENFALRQSYAEAKLVRLARRDAELEIKNCLERSPAMDGLNDADLERLYADTQSSVQTVGDSLVDGESIDQLERQVSQAEAAANVARDELLEKKTEVAPLMSAVEEAQFKLHSLNKRLRLAQADSWGAWSDQNRIKHQIDACDSSIQSKRENLGKDQLEYDVLMTRISELAKSKSAKESRIEETKQLERNEHFTFDKLVDDRRNLVAKQREAQLAASRQETVVDNAVELLVNARTVPGDVIAGLAIVQRVVRELDLEDKYYGVLADLIEFDPACVTAAERAAPGALFYHVVTNLDVAITIMKGLEDYSCSATLVPLADLVVPEIPEISLPIQNAVPLSNLIRAKLMGFEKCVDVVWGPYLLTRDLNTAAELVLPTQRPCVTLEGDILEPNGVVDGGSLPPTHATEIITAIRMITSHAKLAKDRYLIGAAYSRELEELDASINASYAAIQSLKLERSQLHISCDHIDRETDAQEDEAKKLAMILHSREESLKTSLDTRHALERDLEVFKDKLELNKIEAAKAEVKELGEFIETNSKSFNFARHDLDVLSVADRSAADHLSIVKTKLDKARKKAAATENSRQLTMEMSQTLLQLRSKIRQATQELDALVQYQNAQDQKIKSLWDHWKKLDEDTRMIHSSLREFKKAEAELIDQLTALSRESTQKSNLILSLALNAGLPAGDISEASQSLSGLNLERLEEKLSSLGPINERATTQYEAGLAAYTRLRASHYQLRSWRRQLRECSREIAKSDAIWKFFLLALPKFCAQFTYIFSELTGGAVGTMTVGDDGVKFDTQFGAEEVMSQGQATICSLAFIFALQSRCGGPLSFFDEIDSHLDANHRARVAGYMRWLSQAKQVFCATFKPEIVSVANQNFGIYIENKESHIVQIDTQLALSFIQHEEAAREQNEREKVEGRGGEEQESENWGK